MAYYSPSIEKIIPNRIRSPVKDFNLLRGGLLRVAQRDLKRNPAGKIVEGLCGRALWRRRDHRRALITRFSNALFERDLTQKRDLEF